MKKSEILNSLLLSLPELKDRHSPFSATSILLKKTARREIEDLFSDGNETIEFGEFGKLVFPYFKMGETVSSLSLFDLDELIIFIFYWINRVRYKKVIDIGANIGLHSIILNKCGYEVSSFEPDPIHYERIIQNFEKNEIPFKNVLIALYQIKLVKPSLFVFLETQQEAISREVNQIHMVN